MLRITMRRKNVKYLAAIAETDSTGTPMLIFTFTFTVLISLNAVHNTTYMLLIVRKSLKGLKHALLNYRPLL